MARSTVWRRSVNEYADLSTSPKNLFKVPVATLAEDETLTRTLLTWQTQHYSPSHLHGVGFMITVGLITVPGGTGAGSVPAPLSDPGTDWVWWESQVVRPANYVYDGADTEGMDIAGPDSDIRESRGQRLASGGPIDAWFVAQGSTLSSSQSEFWLSFAVSLLVLEPAV